MQNTIVIYSCQADLVSVVHQLLECYAIGNYIEVPLQLNDVNCLLAISQFQDDQLQLIGFKPEFLHTSAVPLKIQLVLIGSPKTRR